MYRQCDDAIAVLQSDNDQLEQEKSALKERLRQLTKTKLVDDLIQKKIDAKQKVSERLSNYSYHCLSFIIKFSSLFSFFN